MRKYIEGQLLANIGRNFFDNRICFVVAATVIVGTAISYLLCSYEPHVVAAMMIAVATVIVIITVPYLGLGILGFTLPFAGLLQIMPSAFTASKLLAVFLVASFVYHVFITNKITLLQPSRALQYYLLLPFWCLATLPFSLEPIEGLDGLATVFLVTGLTYLVASIPASSRQLKVVCFLTTASAACLGMYILVWGIDGLTRDYSARLAAGTNENVLAHALSVCLLMSLFIVRNSRWRLVFLVILLDVFILYAIALTGSRGTWVSLAICICVPLVVVRGVPFGKRLALFVVAGLFMALTIYVVTENMFGMSGRIAERFYEINAGEEASGGRLEFIWPAYIKSFIDNPIFGNGLGFRSSQLTASHNNVLYVASHLGLIGLFIYAMMWINLLRESLSNDDGWMRVTAVVIITFLFFSGMTHDTLWLKSNAFAVGILLCVNTRKNINDNQ